MDLRHRPVSHGHPERRLDSHRGSSAPGSRAAAIVAWGAARSGSAGRAGRSRTTAGRCSGAPCPRCSEPSAGWRYAAGSSARLRSLLPPAPGASRPKAALSVGRIPHAFRSRIQGPPAPALALFLVLPVPPRPAVLETCDPAVIKVLLGRVEAVRGPALAWPYECHDRPGTSAGCDWNRR